MIKKTKYKKLKDDIIKLLTTKGIDDYDINLVDELVFNFQLIDKVKEDLLAGDYMKNVRKDESYPLMQITPQMSVYKDCLKNIITISSKLAITPLERNKLGMPNTGSKDDDGF